MNDPDHSLTVNADDRAMDNVEVSNLGAEASLASLLRRRASAETVTLNQPYAVPPYLDLAECYRALHYPDLAAGAAYKALLLVDAIGDESDEYHDRAVASTREFLQDREDRSAERLEAVLRSNYTPKVYRLLVRSLIECSCFQIAWNFFSQAKGLFPNDDSIVQLDSEVHNAFAAHLKASDGTNNESVRSRPLSWPNQGLVRRERYPWNSWEPDRLHALPTLNRMMNRVAPKLEIRVVDLPDLTDASNAEKSVSTQLGVFAKEKINPDEVVLDETSLLTANNKLQDALCDACSVDLPNLDDPAAAQVVPCEECEVVFCSQRCHDLATELYHPALCSADVESIAKNVHATEAADALYSLLLLRAFAMAETQRLHPLELPEIQYIWGDFHDPHRGNDHNRSLHEVRRLPRTLPFSFDNNIRLPLHMLEKMDIDIFSDPRYDVWVFNTLYAKFRGTASARLSGRGGRAIRGPEVGAVHPMWCMANHSCDPNVGWEWGGGIRLWARDERPAWKRAGEEDHRTQAGIEAGQEILNHYCDVDLPVRDRREWARGALGGDCRCQRCQWEAGEI